MHTFQVSDKQRKTSMARTFAVVLFCGLCLVHGQFNTNGYTQSCCSYTREQLESYSQNNVHPKCNANSKYDIEHKYECARCAEGLCYASNGVQGFCFCPSRFLVGDAIHIQCQISHDIQWPYSAGEPDTRNCGTTPAPKPSKDPKPTNEPKPTDNPKPSNEPKPIDNPEPTNEPKPEPRNIKGVIVGVVVAAAAVIAIIIIGMCFKANQKRSST